SGSLAGPRVGRGSRETRRPGNPPRASRWSRERGPGKREERDALERERAFGVSHDRLGRASRVLDPEQREPVERHYREGSRRPARASPEPLPPRGGPPRMGTALQHSTMIAPPRLRPGDRIGIVPPPGPVLRGYVRNGSKVLESAGFRVVLAPHLFERRGHLAGPDGRRSEDFNRMLRDPDIRCLLMARGGYGAMRIADEVDWGAMR